MKLKILVILSLLLLVACNSTEQSSVVCNKPYIQVGTDCCLDVDDNSICDEDEKSKESIIEINEEKTKEDVDSQEIVNSDDLKEVSGIYSIEDQINILLDKVKDNKWTLRYLFLYIKNTGRTLVEPKVRLNLYKLNYDTAKYKLVSSQEDTLDLISITYAKIIKLDDFYFENTNSLIQPFSKYKLEYTILDSETILKEMNYTFLIERTNVNQYKIEHNLTEGLPFENDLNVNYIKIDYGSPEYSKKGEDSVFITEIPLTISNEGDYNLKGNLIFFKYGDFGELVEIEDELDSGDEFFYTLKTKSLDESLNGAKVYVLKKNSFDILKYEKLSYSVRCKQDGVISECEVK